MFYLLVKKEKKTKSSEHSIQSHVESFFHCIPFDLQGHSSPVPQEENVAHKEETRYGIRQTWFTQLYYLLAGSLEYVT